MRLGIGYDQRLVSQRRQQAQHVRGGQVITRAELLGHLQRPAGEDRQPAQQNLLPLGQQVMAPVDRRAQRTLARRRSRATVGQQPEAVVHTGQDLLNSQHPDPGGRQLDSQRDAIQRPAERGDRRKAGRGQGETGTRRGGAVAEQADRLEVHKLLGVLRRTRLGQRQR